MAGSNSVVRSWRRNTAGELCNKWRGVTCNDAKLTSEVKLPYSNLRGVLPVEWAALSPSLRQVTMAGNKVMGSLPREWRSLKQLYFVRMDDNDLSGPLPAEWSDLSLLSTVNLQQNFLTGPLPGSWGRLGNLAEMYLNSNMINGSLPDAWSKMDSLYFLTLDNNQLTGTIPASWGAMPSLRFISLHDNPLLRGCVPNAWRGRVRFQGKGTNFEYKAALYDSGVLDNTALTGWCGASSSAGGGAVEQEGGQ